MGKNKLKKFAEIENLSCVLQYPRERLMSEGFPFKGKWRDEIFGNQNPIVLELGCGKGEYTVGLAKVNPQKNFVGIDIKGARIWRGAKDVAENNIANARFLRTEIENIGSFYADSEVDELWITFPDPQMQKPRKRLTSSRFLKLYSQLLKSDGIVHLKTDSPFLYEYTRRIVSINGLKLIEQTADLYGSGMADPVKSIKTFYESQWLSRGKSIKLISFMLKGENNTDYKEEKVFLEPESEDIPKDDYRAYTRHNPMTSEIQ